MIDCGLFFEKLKWKILYLFWSFTFFLKCLSAELLLDQDYIDQMAIDIQNAIVGVPDVDQILADTGDDVINAEQLKNDAEEVKTEAKTQLDIAEKIIKELSNAAVSQDAAETAVCRTQNDINSARTNLGQVSFLNFSYLWFPKTDLC